MRLAIFRLAVLATLLFGSQASADFKFSLDKGNTSTPGLVPDYTGPYATVDVNLTDSTHATITLASLSNGNFTYLFNDGGIFGLNVNGAYNAVVAGNITFTQPSGFSGWTFKNNVPGSEDGFGDFNLSLNSTSGDFNKSLDSLTLVLTKTSGTWTNDTDVLTKNGSNELAAAHVFVWDRTLPISDGARTTGFASGDGSSPPPSQEPNPVPEPSSLVMAGIGIGCIGLYGLVRRKKLALSM